MENFKMSMTLKEIKAKAFEYIEFNKKINSIMNEKKENKYNWL